MKRYTKHILVCLVLLGSPAWCMAATVSYGTFCECLAGPGMPPTPPPPHTPQECLDAYDADEDGDVDLLDFAAQTYSFMGDYPDVTVTVTPYSPPITIPDSGGSFSYSLDLTNNESVSVTCAVWTAYTLPDGTQSPTVFGPEELVLPAGWSAGQDLDEYVSAEMPSGTYTYNAYVGLYPDTPWSTDSFQFEKLPETAGWYAQSPGTTTDLRALTFVNSESGWAVGNVNTILHTVDGGDTWYPQDDGQYYLHEYDDVFFISPQVGWVVGSGTSLGGTILHTTDGGETWNEQVPDLGEPFHGVDFVDADHGWAVGGFVGGTFGDTYIRTIEHTADGGATWSGQLYQYNEKPLASVSFVDADNGWAVGDQGAILHTANGGADWYEQSSGTSSDLLGVCFVDANTGWCVGRNGNVLHTADGGVSWVAQDSQSPSATLYGVQFLDADTGWIVGIAYDPNHAVILHTTDGGDTWQQQDPGTADAVIYLQDVFFLDAQQGWTAGGVFYPFEGVMLHTESGGGDIVEPVLSFSPPSYDFGDQFDGETASTTFSIWNGGTGPLNYFFYPCYPWVSVTPESGYSTGEMDEITLEIDTAGMEEGDYVCDVQVFSNGGYDVFTVSVHVVPSTPILAFDPTAFDFGDLGQYDMGTGTLDIWNGGSGTLYYFFDEGCDWVVCDPWSGSSTGEVDEVTVMAFTSPLEPGPHECTVTINSSAGPDVFTVYVNVVPD
jgi:photosystem II stability/assembly factor-like uncharacterized protein